MRPVGIGSGPEAGLPANKKPDPRGEALQSLHLQLRQKIHEHRHQIVWRQLPHVQQRSLGDRAQEVSAVLQIKMTWLW